MGAGKRQSEELISKPISQVGKLPVQRDLTNRSINTI